MARVRLGNEERMNRYWEPEEKRKCRLCQGERETLDHLTKNCRPNLKGKGNIATILSEEGAGQTWLKKLKAERKQRYVKNVNIFQTLTGWKLNTFYSILLGQNFRSCANRLILSGIQKSNFLRNYKLTRPLIYRDTYGSVVNMRLNSARLQSLFLSLGP